ncbi:hypothetical protein N656DRAFT_800995 [Canariomyces notabilis]|uniref:Ribosomal protein L34 n=1 Tax=Canariomyces notabilis TaxID=2074819 RepID=A0AAN6QMV2_9PEZI|nr:hypothetical protein N656DRAFT_800995 [Canariomyces arenarius]
MEIKRSRTFTNLPTLRPTLLNTTNQNSVFRAPNLTALSRTGPQPVVAAGTAAGAEGETIDVIARQSITGHPALGGVHQIRCGPRPTMSGHSRLIQKRRHGFLSRIRKHHGRNTLARRRAKGRKRLSA